MAFEKKKVEQKGPHASPAAYDGGGATNVLLFLFVSQTTVMACGGVVYDIWKWCVGAGKASATRGV